MKCEYCQSGHVKKNGNHQNGQQNWQCLDCRRQYVEHPLRRTISEETKNQVRSLLKERLSLRSICRQTGVTSLLECFNCTLRQFVSCLVRKTSSFAKSLAGLDYRLKYFIGSFNLAFN